MSSASSLLASPSSPIQRVWFDVLPASVRFATAGLIGNVFFFRIDRALHPIFAAGLVGSSSGSSLPNNASVYSSAAADASAEVLRGSAAVYPPSFIGSRASAAVSEYLLSFLRNNSESASFFVAYLMSIVIQHALNALLVFGVDTIQTRELYLSSLSTAYTTYFGTLCASTILQANLLKWGVSKPMAFWCTIGISSVANYVLLTSSSPSSKEELSSSEKEKMEERLSLRGGGDDGSGDVASSCLGFVNQARWVGSNGNSSVCSGGAKVGRGGRRKRMAAVAAHSIPRTRGGGHWGNIGGGGGAIGSGIGGMAAALPVLVEAKSEANGGGGRIIHEWP